LSIAQTPTLIFLAPCLQSGACTQNNSIARLCPRGGQHTSTTAVLCCAALRWPVCRQHKTPSSPIVCASCAAAWPARLGPSESCSRCGCLEQRPRHPL
jgi:hypothetical protein